MKKAILSFIVIVLVSFGAFAQFDSSPSSGNSKPRKAQQNQVKQQVPLRDRIVVGGGLDLQFGDVTFIGVTPLVGYYVTDDFLAGGIFTYRYIQYNYLVPKYSTSTYGVAPFLRYNIYKGIFAHVEYEALYGEWRFKDDPFWLTSLFVGGGYNAQIGDRGFAGVYVLWNLTENPNYLIYSNPVVRFSFGVGF